MPIHRFQFRHISFRITWSLFQRFVPMQPCPHYRKHIFIHRSYLQKFLLIIVKNINQFFASHRRLVDRRFGELCEVTLRLISVRAAWSQSTYDKRWTFPRTFRVAYRLYRSNTLIAAFYIFFTLRLTPTLIRFVWTLSRSQNIYINICVLKIRTTDHFNGSSEINGAIYTRASGIDKRFYLRRGVVDSCTRKFFVCAIFFSFNPGQRHEQQWKPFAPFVSSLSRLAI